MPIQGFTRLRRWQVGRQSAFGTAVTPTRVIPLRGNPSLELGYEDPDVDLGLIDPSLDPYRTGLDISASLTGIVDFDSLPIYYGAHTRGAGTPTGGGAAKTWTITAASDTVPDRDFYTAQWGDEVTADQFQYKDGIIENLTFTLPENLGPWEVNADFRFGSYDTYPTTRAVLSASSNTNVFAFGADTELFINDTAGAIGTTKISDALTGAEISISQTVDQKRYANGSNTRFQLAGYGFSGREISVDVTFHKTSQAIMDEVADWLNASPVERFLEFRTTSPSIITGSTPYSWSQFFNGHWFTRSDGEAGGNTTITLSLRGKYDADLTYPYRARIVNSLAALP